MLSQSSCGNDEELLDQAIAEYLRAEAAGQAGDRQQWLDRYPACATGLVDFFDDRERVDRMMVPLRLDSPPGSSRVRATQDLGSPHASQPAETPAPQPPCLATTRYRPIRYHAGGGMGEIWLAEDERIGRHVALKKLRTGRSDEHARFVVEAQITGQLEHPSIVPLHDVGLDDAGQPYYIMKFIKGRRLREAIAEFHAKNDAADLSDNLDFRRLLETFVSICNVVAYAHSKGVLHRDIKPDNVMLGPYGETLVVDWGLAKVIGQPDETRGSCVQLSGGESTATQDGAIVGSPYYMPPEGAEGHPEAVDQSSDVYLLGATLYEIMTARPPRHGSSNWKLIDLARHSRPTDPRKLNPHIPRSLEAICLKAIAFRKEDRYAAPMDLADDIERFLAGAPTAAYQEPLAGRVWRWIRRHRRGILGGLAFVAVMLLSGLALLGFRQAHTLAAREQAREQLSEFNRLADETQFFAANTDPISERVPYYDPNRATIAGDAARTIASQWGVRAERLPLPSERAPFLQTYYELLLVLAHIELQQRNHDSDPHQALTLLNAAREIQPPSRGYYELSRLSLTLLGEKEAAARELERANQPDTPVTAQDHFLGGELLRLQDVGTAAAVIGSESLPDREHLEKSLEEYRHALQLDPQHYWARFQLGRCLLALGRRPEAIEALSACIAIRPDVPWAYSARGLASAQIGQTQAAFEDLDKALKLDPDFQPARLNRGVVHWLMENNDDAKTEFDAVLTAPVERRLIEAAYYRGQVLQSEGDFRAASADFSAMISGQPTFRLAYWLRAKSRYQLGDISGGFDDVKQYLAFEPNQPTQITVAEPRLALGRALRMMGQQLEGDARIKVLTQADEELREAIAAGPPTADMWQHLAAVHELRGKYSEVIDAYSQALAISAADVQLRNMRGWAYVNMKKYDLAQMDFTETVRISPKNAEAHAGLGFVLAELSGDKDAHQEATAALLSGADNQLILHQVACVFARLSTAQTDRRTEFENLAITALERAVLLWQRNPIGPDTDELTLIRNEKSFPTSLRSRPEFKRLLSGEWIAR